MERANFFIKVFGCQMNRYDADVLSELFSRFGMKQADSPDEAKLVHIHTCCVRQKAEDKFFSFLGEMRLKKKKDPSLVIGVGGCIPERTPLLEKYPFIDYVIGAGEPGAYGEQIERIVGERIAGLVVAASAMAESHVTRFCTVIRGCSNYCSYCVVPYVRGGEASRPPEEIAAEVERMVGDGAREIILLGQNVLAYGDDLEPGKDLIDVVRLIHPIERLLRIRFVTSHPRWVREIFLQGLKEYPKVCEHFHVPCQAGDDEILRRMNRGYTAAEYEETVAMIRRYFPGASITADVIVGFPGETDEQFRRTLELLERVRADSVYSFKYSTRSGTAAARYEDEVEPVPLEVKKDRLRILNELQEAISREINDELVGTKVEVLIDEVVEGDENRYRGRTRTNRIVDFTSESPLSLGELTDVSVSKATPHALVGKM